MPSYPTGSPFEHFYARLKEFGLETFNLFYGRYRGYVVDIEEGADTGKIQVRLPILGHKEGDWIWAYPKFPTPCGKVTGDGETKYYGMYVPPPKVGTTVWIEFEVGRTKHAIYTGGWFPKEGLPEKIASAAPYVWSIWSYAQHHLTFIDKEGKEEVELAWMGKHRITMDKDHLLVTTENGTQLELKADGTFVIKDEKDNEVISSSSGLEVKAGTAKVLLQSGTAEIHAKTFTWGPGGSTAAAKATVRGEDLVKVLNELVSVLMSFGAVGAGGITTGPDPATIARLSPLIAKLNKTLVPTFKV